MSYLVWLVTGCSPGGFGECFVHGILARGDKVIATARNLEKVKHFEKAGAAVLQLDITHSQQNINDVISKAISIYGRIDVLVNNAAYVAIGTWEDLEADDFQAQFDTNVFGTIKVTRAVLPHFRQRHAGTAVFIGSLSGWVGHPGVGAYAGSKHALEGQGSRILSYVCTLTVKGIVESLHHETSHLGIRTLLIEPGRFRTLLLSSQNMKAVQTKVGDYARFNEALLEGLAREDQRQPGDPVKLAKIVVDLVRGEGVAQGRYVPFRLPLGIDCFDEVKAKCEETLKLLEDWKDVIRSTDHDDQTK
ncbi:putative oxidoreductase [Cladophialophora carrionii]|uniref:Putative oxidoreductase n=1 Tax=Cladophialophora carrionii TaxID=86049 RepID=A0A1C1CLD6_9EURO|nr:putative oxidoreductase [Cladophialophora carrionii]